MLILFEVGWCDRLYAIMEIYGNSFFISTGLQRYIDLLETLSFLEISVILEKSTLCIVFANRLAFWCSAFRYAANAKYFYKERQCNETFRMAKISTNFKVRGYNSLLSSSLSLFYIQDVLLPDWQTLRDDSRHGDKHY